MQAVQGAFMIMKVDTKVDLNKVEIEKAIMESLPDRNYDNLNQDQRRSLFTTVEHVDDEIISY